MSIIHPPPKLVYRIYDSKDLSNLVQLCAGLGKLNFYKFKQNFRDTLNPLCPTNDVVEDTEHYFLLCHTYDAKRDDLLNSVNAISLLHYLKKFQMKSC